MEEITLLEKLNTAEKITLTIDNKIVYLNKDEILDEFNNMAEDSYFSPALGVSLDNLTREEKKEGVWLEFFYSEETKFAELPFTSLLVHIQPKFYGFNLIRCFNEKYEGRCLYLNLSKPSTQFYNYLISKK